MTEPAATPPADAVEDHTVEDDAVEDDDGLPPEDDPSWDETTTETLRLLRDVRQRSRRARLRETAYVSYVAALAVAIYVAPNVVHAVRAPADAATAGTPPALLLGAVAVILLVLVALLRDGLWRGPVLLDAAAAGWLLPLPIRRETLLRPRLTRALVAAGLLGAAAGSLGGVLLRLVGGGSAPLLAAAGAATGAVVMILGVAVGALAETAGGTPHATLRRIGPALWLLPAVPVALAVLPVGAAPQRVAAGVLLWSGPWGWALQPLAVALPDGAPAGVSTAWPLALVAAGAVAAAAVAAARRRVGALSNQLLRTRAATVTAVSQSLGTLQPRRARLLVEAAQGRVPDTRRRLPLPHHRPLLLPWRDATALLRAPSRLVWGLIWLATAAPLAAAAGGDRGLPRLGLAVAALGAGYLAVAQLVEGARLDADDARTVRSLPLSWSQVVIGHLVTPLVLLLAACAVADPVLGLVAPARWVPVATLTLLAPALPALTGGALVSAFRGQVPLALLATGAPSPAGDPGPLLVLLWYLRGPLAAVALLLPLLIGGQPLLSATVAAAAMIGWATFQARRVLG